MAINLNSINLAQKLKKIGTRKSMKNLVIVPNFTGIASKSVANDELECYNNARRLFNSYHPAIRLCHKVTAKKYERKTLKNDFEQC